MADIVYGATGINFAEHAHAGGMTTELLDDYEEGTWTGAATGASFSYGNTTAFYKKVGNICSWTWYSSATTISSSSGAGGGTGLPFTSFSSNPGSYWTFQYVHGNALDNYCTGGYINHNDTSFNFIGPNTTGGAGFVNGSSKYWMISCCMGTT